MAWTERYVRADAAGGGDGTTDTNSGANGAWTLAEGITNASPGMKLWLKNGDYTGTSVTDFNSIGSTSQLIWWCGFDSTPGDLDAATVTTNFPHINRTSNGYVTTSGGFHLFSNIKFTSATASATRGTIYLSNTTWLHRCKIIYNGTTAANMALRGTGASDNSFISDCWIESTYSSATHYVVSMISNGRYSIIGCYVKGGYRSVQSTGGCGILYGNIFDGAVDGGVCLDGVDTLNVVQNTFYNLGGSAVRIFTGNTTTSVVVAGNIFSNITGRGVASADVHSNCMIVNNVYRSCSSGNILNIYQDEEFGAVNASADVLVDPSNGDFRPKGDAIGAGTGNQFCGLPNLRGYRDAGAIQLGV